MFPMLAECYILLPVLATLMLSKGFPLSVIIDFAKFSKKLVCQFWLLLYFAECFHDHAVIKCVSLFRDIVSNVVHVEANFIL